MQSPQEDGALEALKLQIRRALEQQEEFRKELLERLPKEFHPQITQAVNATGENIKIVQNKGDGNTISIQ